MAFKCPRCCRVYRSKPRLVGTCFCCPGCGRRLRVYFAVVESLRRFYERSRN